MKFVSQHLVQTNLELLQNLSSPQHCGDMRFFDFRIRIVKKNIPTIILFFKNNWFHRFVMAIDIITYNQIRKVYRFPLIYYLLFLLLLLFFSSNKYFFVINRDLNAEKGSKSRRAKYKYRNQKYFLKRAKNGSWQNFKCLKIKAPVVVNAQQLTWNLINKAIAVIGVVLIVDGILFYYTHRSFIWGPVIKYLIFSQAPKTDFSRWPNLWQLFSTKVNIEKVNDVGQSTPNMQQPIIIKPAQTGSRLSHILPQIKHPGPVVHKPPTGVVKAQFSGSKDRSKFIV